MFEINEILKNEKGETMVDLSKYTAKTAAKKLCAGLIKMGFEASLLDPKKSEANGWGAGWYVISEGVPYDGLVCLSLGGSIYCGEWDNYDYKRKPEFKITGADKYLAEPYHTWWLGFFPEN